MIQNYYHPLVPYENNNIEEGRICQFDLHDISVECVNKFAHYISPYGVATTEDKVCYFMWHC